jgi:hypothetical protein
MFNFESELRNDRESFDQVRKLLPTRYRFRIVDADGKDIRHRSSAAAFKGETHPSSTAADFTAIHSKAIHSTRIEYGGPISGNGCSSGGGYSDTDTGSGIGSHGEDDPTGHIAEHPAVYRLGSRTLQAMAL